MKTLPSLKRLEYLIALVDEEHFGKAAKVCNVTPSTLSAGIRDLEELLGSNLAERTKRQVLITDFGHEVAKRARRLITEAEDIIDLARTHQAPMTGIMKMGIIPTVGPYLVHDIVPAITQEYPGLQLLLREEQTDLLLSKLHEGQLDVAIIALPYDIDGLEVHPLFDDEFQFACTSKHELSGRQIVHNEDLLSQSLLLLEDGHCLRDHALDACSLGDRANRAQFEATSLATLVQMVASNLGVTLIPKLVSDSGLMPTKNIALIPLSNHPFRTIGLVWRATSSRRAEFEKLAKTIITARTHIG
ncbi:MAG: hydrogen peroxide-inducible genes activator [Pseudomonas marincola]